MVTPAGNSKFNCDCANYRSLSICSHVVAVAELNSKLGQFIEWYRKANKIPSLSKLATSDMPKGRGRKGGQAPRKKQAKTPVTARIDLINVASTESTLASEVEKSATPCESPVASHHITTPDSITATSVQSTSLQPTFQHRLLIPWALQVCHFLTRNHTQ